MPGLEKPMQIKRKADGWIVMDDKGMHKFASEEEAKKYAGLAPKEEPKKEEKAEEKE